jgi:hypothetical protein
MRPTSLARLLATMAELIRWAEPWDIEEDEETLRAQG